MCTWVHRPFIWPPRCRQIWCRFFCIWLLKTNRRTLHANVARISFVHILVPCAHKPYLATSVTVNKRLAFWCSPSWVVVRSAVQCERAWDILGHMFMTFSRRECLWVNVLWSARMFDTHGRYILCQHIGRKVRSINNLVEDCEQDNVRIQVLLSFELIIKFVLCNTTDFSETFQTTYRIRA